jgi:uncharacterized membrane protein
VGRVGEQGIAVIDEVYPDLTGTADALKISSKSGKWAFLSSFSRNEAPPSTLAVKRGEPDRIIHYLGRSGIVLALNLQELVTEARRAGCVLEFAHQVGDFVATDEPLFYVHGNAEAIDARRLQANVALGSERTMEQDPMFAFRIEVDIALKALSAAINDPTTAVLAIDQLHRLLRMVGFRSLQNEEVLDDAGQLRLVFHTPNWEDFVHISFREIRLCGAHNLQIARRLRDLIEDLLLSLPEHRHPALQKELELLDRALVESYKFPEDLALARIADSQGMGGASGRKPQR